MKINISIPIILLAAIAVSCSKESTRISERHSLQVICADSKVSLNSSVQTVWNTGDKVSVFFGNETNSVWQYDGENNATSGNIVYNDLLVKGDGPVYAIYPADATATLAGSDITASLPASQSLKEASFGAAVLVAKTTSTALHFNYASALLRIDIPGPITVTGITVKNHGAANIAGDMVIDCSGAAPVAAPGANGSTTITLSTDSPVTIASGVTKSFYVSIIPGDYQEGIEVVADAASGRSYSAVIAPLTVTGGQCGTVNVNSDDDLLVIDVRFANASGTWQNPFTVRPTASHIVDGEETIAFYLISDTSEQYPFKFCVSETTTNLAINGGGWIRVGGKAGDYIKFPAVAGYRLKEVATKVTSNYPFSICTTAKVPVSGGESVSPPGIRYAHTFILSGTEANTSYLLVNGADHYQDYYFFTLKYEAVL